MTKIYNSKIIKGILFLLGYVGIFCFIYTESLNFKQIYKKYIDINVNGGIIALGIISFFIMIYFIFKSSATFKPFEIINKFDFLLLFTIAILILLIMFRIIIWGRFFSIILMLLPFLFYSVATIIVITFVYRLRDKTLTSTTFLYNFYKIYPLSTKTGLIFTIVFLVNIIFVFSKLIEYVLQYSYLNIIDTFGIVASTITLFGLVYLNLFLVSLKKSYENEIVEKMKAENFKTELITNVSHDIRTPLTSIINYVDLIKQLKIENKELNGYTDVLEKKTNRLKILINDLMEASKAKTGNINVNIQKLDLVEIIGQIVGEFDSEFLKRELDFVFNYSENKLCILADGKLLWRILENIFSNLLKYSMEKTRIYCNILVLDNSIKLSFVNTSKEPLNITSNELLEQFTRGDKSRKTEGSGLGLYIIEALSELMDCEFNIKIKGDSFESNVIFKKSN